LKIRNELVVAPRATTNYDAAIQFVMPPDAGQMCIA
jgi:hypothetical protein